MRGPTFPETPDGGRGVRTTQPASMHRIDGAVGLVDPHVPRPFHGAPYERSWRCKNAGGLNSAPAHGAHGFALLGGRSYTPESRNENFAQKTGATFNARMNAANRVRNDPRRWGGRR